MPRCRTPDLQRRNPLLFSIHLLEPAAGPTLPTHLVSLLAISALQAGDPTTMHIHHSPPIGGAVAGMSDSLTSK